jgi:predicted kinase
LEVDVASPITSGKPVLVLVTGAPGTGKSTVAHEIAALLGAAVLAHDWAMSGLRPYPEIQRVLDAMPLGHREVGWSILGALARAELRADRSVVLDGVARAPEIERCRDHAASEGARLVVVATRCSERALHRSRVDGRERRIPDWYELDWPSVERSVDGWEEPEGADLRLDTAADWDHTVALVRRLLA